MYEALLEEAHERGLTVIERYPFASPRIRGLCCDDTIALSAQIETEAERTVILCEEMTHAARSAGNILRDPRMERRAREYSFDRLIGPAGLVHACLAGCREPWEFAEWLGVPVDYFVRAVENYRERFGVRMRVTVRAGTFLLTLLPTLFVRRLMRDRRGRPKGTLVEASKTDGTVQAAGAPVGTSETDGTTQTNCTLVGTSETDADAHAPCETDADRVKAPAAKAGESEERA